MSMVYKNNVNTTKALEAHYAKPVIINEAQKAALRRAAKRTAMYGIAGVTLCSVLILGGVVTTLKVQAFFKTNEVVFKLPVEIETKTNQVVSIRPITKAKTVFVENPKANDAVIKAAKDPTIAEKICAKFKDRCEVAVAVATAESNLRADAIGVNTNKTTDIGIFQINFQTHKAKAECSLEKISTVDGNIDCAYRIYKDNGESFSPWVAFNSGAYLARLK